MLFLVFVVNRQIGNLNMYNMCKKWVQEDKSTIPLVTVSYNGGKKCDCMNILPYTKHVSVMYKERDREET